MPTLNFSSQEELNQYFMTRIEDLSLRVQSREILLQQLMARLTFEESLSLADFQEQIADLSDSFVEAFEGREYAGDKKQAKKLQKLLLDAVDFSQAPSLEVIQGGQDDGDDGR